MRCALSLCTRRTMTAPALSLLFCPTAPGVFSASDLQTASKPRYCRAASCPTCWTIERHGPQMTLFDRCFYVTLLTVSALLLFIGLALAIIAGVSPILSGSIILANSHSQINGNYHLFPLLYLAVGQALSLIVFSLGWAFHPTRFVMRWHLIVCGAAWLFVLAIALVLYGSFRLGWPGL